MKRWIVLGTAALLASCNQAEAPPENAMAMNETLPADETVGDANLAVPAALTSLTETTWEWTDPESGKVITQSVDSSGNYISQAGTEHFDHGSAVMKDGKGCFDSAMDQKGEMCWSDPQLAVGQSGETVSDDGQKLPIKRVEYKPLTM